MHLSAYQFDATLGEVAHNLERIESILGDLRPAAHDVVLFPEMCDTGYDMEVIRQHAVTWGPDHLAGIRARAAEKQLTVILGLSEREGNRVYNTTAVIGPDGQLNYKYRKTHLVSIRPIEEHLHITPGNELGAFALPHCPAGLMTCYELRFPEVARTLTLGGIQVLFVPAAWPLIRVEHLTALLRARAIENQIFIVAACRVGTDANTVFSGHSMIIDPNGTVLARAGDAGEELLAASVDLEDAARSRERIGALGERRPRLYRGFSDL